MKMSRNAKLHHTDNDFVDIFTLKVGCSFAFRKYAQSVIKCLYSKVYFATSISFTNLFLIDYTLLV